MFGGQQDTMAENVVAGSLEHPALVHAPDSPSPEVFTITDKLAPGLQPGATVIVQQKSHAFAGGVITKPEFDIPSPKLFPGFPSASEPQLTGIPKTSVT